jgi:hypothetical protein
MTTASVLLQNSGQCWGPGWACSFAVLDKFEKDHFSGPEHGHPATYETLYPALTNIINTWPVTFWSSVLLHATNSSMAGPDQQVAEQLQAWHAGDVDLRR